MGETGSVAWMFERKGVITVKRDGKPEDEMMEIILDAGADDLSTEEDFFEVTTTLENFEHVRKMLIDKKLTVENASLHWTAKNLTPVKGEDAEKLMKLIEAIEESDDLQNVFTNADFVD